MFSDFQLIVVFMSFLAALMFVFVRGKSSNGNGNSKSLYDMFLSERRRADVLERLLNKCLDNDNDNGAPMSRRESLIRQRNLIQQQINEMEVKIASLGGPIGAPHKLMTELQLLYDSLHDIEASIDAHQITHHGEDTP